MRRLLPSPANSHLFSATQRRRAWLALWVQDRRRDRLAAAVPAEPALLLEDGSNLQLEDGSNLLLE